MQREREIRESCKPNEKKIFYSFEGLKTSDAPSDNETVDVVRSLVRVHLHAIVSYKTELLHCKLVVVVSLCRIPFRD